MSRSIRSMLCDRESAASIDALAQFDSLIPVESCQGVADAQMPT